MKKRLVSLGLCVSLLLSSLGALADGPKFERISGDDRYQTSIAISKEAFETSDTAIIASGEDFADALAGSQLAVHTGAPIILNPKKGKNPGLEDELKRLGVKDVYILGGEASISKELEESLLENYKPIRLAGEDRYETSRKILEETKKYGEFSKLIYVSGTVYADALAAGGVLKEQNALLMLSNGQRLDQEELEELAVGGENTLKLDGFDGERIAGKNRYETSLKLAKTLGDKASSILASGESFPDALSAVGLSYKTGSPIILSGKNALDPAVRDYLASKEKVYIVGGENTLSNAIIDSFRPEAPNSPNGTSLEERHDAVLAHINELRAELGLDKLIEDTFLGMDLADEEVYEKYPAYYMAVMEDAEDAKSLVEVFDTIENLEEAIYNDYTHIGIGYHENLYGLDHLWIIRIGTKEDIGLEDFDADIETEKIVDQAEFAAEVFALTNDFRRENGLEELDFASELQDYAYLRAEEIAKVFSHTRPNGVASLDHPLLADYHRGENIAYNYSAKAW